MLELTRRIKIYGLGEVYPKRFFKVWAPAWVDVQSYRTCFMDVGADDMNLAPSVPQLI